MTRFPSKIDAWLLALLIVGVVGQIVALVAVMSADTAVIGRMILVAILLAGVLLIGSVLFRTHYTVAGDTIRIVSGPFAWTIPIPEIVDIEETRSPLSSPALSLDRLRITYSRNRCILVSPKDRQGFLNAIAQSSAAS